MRLRRATPAEAAERDAASFAAWGGGVSLAWHLDREAALRAGEWPREALTPWLLEAGGAVLASCETYAVPSSVGPSRGTTYAVASVFTEPALRGRGYASALLGALAAELAARPGAQAMLLFSDVGVELYARLGFMALPAWDRVDDALAAPGHDDLPGLVSFAEEELAAAWPAGAALPPADPAALTLHPTLAQLRWHLDEARLSAVGRAPLPACGAQFRDAGMVWVLDPRADELLVLAAGGSPAALGALWTHARRVAGRAGLRGVRAWETAGADPWPADLGRREPRDGQVPMVRPLAAGVPAAVPWMPRLLWV